MSEHLKMELNQIALSLEFLKNDVERLYSRHIEHPLEPDNEVDQRGSQYGFDWLRTRIDEWEKEGIELAGISMTCQTAKTGIEDGFWKREPTGKCLLKVFYTMPKGG